MTLSFTRCPSFLELWEQYGVCVCSVRQEMEEEVRQMQETIQDMERSCDLLYAPYEPDPNHSPVCRNLTQKQGYLYIRKYGILYLMCLLFLTFAPLFLWADVLT